MRKFVAATVSAALCMTSMLPGIAAAQEHRFTGFDAPRGATATVNLRIPLGLERRSRPSYGLTLGYGQTVAPGVDGRAPAGRHAFLPHSHSPAERNPLSGPLRLTPARPYLLRRP